MPEGASAWRGRLRGLASPLSVPELASPPRLPAADPARQVAPNQAASAARHVSNNHAQLGIHERPENHRRVLAVVRFLSR